MPLEPVLWGIALAATAGLRLFMPFLFMGGMARYAGIEAPGMLEWTATDAGFLLLLIATFIEVLSDKIPAVDHALDVGASVLKPAAGLLLPLALLYDASPMGAWVLGIAAGALLPYAGPDGGGGVLATAAMMCLYAVYVNIGLMLFNLLPVPPLDGSHVLYHFLPPAAGAQYRALFPYGFLILYALLFTGALRLFGPVIQFLASLAIVPWMRLFHG